MGYRVHILVDRSEFPYADHVEEGVDIRYLRTSHRIGGVPHLAYYFLKYRPAVVLTPFVQLTLLAVRTRGLLRLPIKLFVNVRSTYSVDFQFLKAGKRRQRIKVMKKYYPKCDGIIAISNGVAKDLCSLTGIPEESVGFIYNPVVTEALMRCGDETIDHPWFQPDQPPVILGVGRLDKVKNFPLLIDAFDKVRSRISCRCVIIGDGPDRMNIQTRALNSPYPQDIKLIGRMDNPFPYMKRSHVLVVCSSWEGFGNVLVEAMAMGTSVVSTDCPYGPREILEDGRLGELVPVDDPTSLSEAILRTLTQPANEVTLKNAVERFRDKEIASAYLSAFDLPDTPQ
jgi:glycosyltransferase involved in cell wall biosynthesis